MKRREDLHGASMKRCPWMGCSSQGLLRMGGGLKADCLQVEPGGKIRYLKSTSSGEDFLLHRSCLQGSRGDSRPWNFQPVLWDWAVLTLPSPLNDSWTRRHLTVTCRSYYGLPCVPEIECFV